MNAPSSPEDVLVPIDDLDREIACLATRINTVTYELLVLVRQFDERVGWLKWGFESCADWLHWRCDFSIVTAREKVRVAHALKTLPSIAAAFSEGALSYSKVRALTRVARRDSEDELIDFATRTTAARVEARCRELRCGSMESLDEARRAHACRSLRIHRDPGRGVMTITVELPLETGELVEKAIDRARDSIASDTPDLVDERWATRHHRLVHEGGFRIERGYRAADIVDDDIGDVSSLLQNPPRVGSRTNAARHPTAAAASRVTSRRTACTRRC